MTAHRSDVGPETGRGDGGLWRDCGGGRGIVPLQGLLHRLVESQEHVATLGYVDTLEEQAVLEALLDGVKPPWPADGGRLHTEPHSQVRAPRTHTSVRRLRHGAG